MTAMSLTIVIPAKNEEKGLSVLLPEIRDRFPGAEIIVVDDASTDSTSSVASANGATVIEHAYSKGNGSAIKSGLRRASSDVIVCMDGDGQHRAGDIEKLLEKLTENYDMVVGKRDKSGQASPLRSMANSFYNRFASWMVGHSVEDLTSGFRAIRKERFSEFISILPNKFSYPTTITMCFFRAGYSVGYVPVDVRKRDAGSKSHINLWRDGVRFLLIIFKVGTLFSPLKIFCPISLSLFLSGLLYYAYTFLVNDRFTNMGLLLFSTSIIVFLMGLVSEQITTLIYKDANR